MHFAVMDRRKFLEFLGRSTAGLTLASLTPTWLTSCASVSSREVEGLPFNPIRPSFRDELILSEGLRYDILIKCGALINSQKERFGFSNDFIGFIPTTSESGCLWVNHESCNPVSVHGFTNKTKRREHVDLERQAVGGSLLSLTLKDGTWNVDTKNPINRRYDGTTPIPFAWKEPILGARSALGTLANCCGGVTPWGTFLSCEENYQLHYGDVSFDNGKRTIDKNVKNWFAWSEFYDLPPEHYGWVVEINPATYQAKKLVALGRFAHEGATVVTADDGRAVVYSGDDKANECLYKFIAKDVGSLEQGTLYVASLEKGEWLPLDIQLSPLLKKYFKSQTEVLIYAREAAKILGGTPLDRPEDIERDPATGAMICALTNHKKKGNFYGSLLKIEEDHNNPLSVRFKSSVFLAGGTKVGVACPDNLAFDVNGNLWMTNDISDEDIGNSTYRSFGNNGLFYIPMSGKNAGQAFQVASAPIHSELTGPCFLPDGKTLLLSVQHPGGDPETPGNATSHWPDGGKSTPLSSVVVITGPVMDRLLTKGS